MWRWQLKSLHSKRLNAWSRLFIFSACAHLCCVFVLFFIYKGSSYHLDLSFNARNLAEATIVLLPFHKKVLQPSRGSSASTSARGSAPAHVADKKATPTTTSEHVEPEQKKISKTVQAATRIVSAPKQAAKNKKKTVRAPSVAKTTQEKNHKKIAEKTVKEKKIQPQQEPADKQKLQNSEPTKTESPSASATPSEPIGSDNQNVVFVGQADLDALAMQQAIQEEIGTHFKPPAGLSSGLSCLLQITVNYQGALTTIIVAQSSGVPIFDIAARNAISKLTLPAWAHGKEITITFNN